MTDEEAIAKALLYGGTIEAYEYVAIDKDGVHWYGRTPGVAARKLVDYWNHHANWEQEQAKK